MAGQPRDRAARTGRKNRAVRTAPAPALVPAAAAIPAASSDPDPAAAGAGPNAGDEAAAWRHCTAEHLEEQLLRRLDEAYAAALARLAELGHDEEAALRAVLRAGHCHGKLDEPVANIVENARAFLSDPEADDATAAIGGFADLRRLEEYSLAGLVCLLQSSRPSLSRAEAMWCLLACDLRLDQASSMGASFTAKSYSTAATGGDGDDSYAAAACHRVPCHFHHAAATATPDTNLFDPDTFMRLAMRQSPASAASFVSCLKASWARTTNAAPDVQGKPSVTKKLSTDGLIESVVAELEVLDLKEKNTEPDKRPNPKNEMVHELIKQIRDMEVQLKERKDWAQQKAIQAARKLSTDLTELRVLRMERDENQLRKKEKQLLEDETMKRLTELENELKKKSGLVDRSNAAVQRLEMENAEIRAEMEAAKLSASESERARQRLLKKEKKDSKKIETWERQIAKLQEEILDCKTKIARMDRELVEVNKQTKELEVKIREGTKAKEQNIALADEERRAKEAAKASADRRIEALQRKIEIDSQRYKDDIQRLREELNRLQSSAIPKHLNVPSTNALDVTDRHAARASKEAVRRLPPASNSLPEPTQKTSCRRECVICKKEEACVIFLQCAHQVLCFGCNKLHEEKGEIGCPCCNVKIDERIRVFGANSN